MEQSIFSDTDKLEFKGNKDMKDIMDNKFKISKYKEVEIIPPFVLNDLDYVDSVKATYYKTLRNIFLASMKESGLKADELEMSAVKKIRFMIEDKFIIEGLLPITIIPIYEFKNGKIVSEDYTIDPFNIEIDLELQSPIKEDNEDIEITYTYKNLMTRLKSVFARQPYMYYSDVKTKNNILYDFTYYLDSAFLMSNIMGYALLGFDTIEYRKMGSIIQIILRNEENFELHSEINSDQEEFKKIRKKNYTLEQFNDDKFFDMDYGTD